ncbi:hypothetical protein VULLAG_LOCUS1135 [Vulpes lagopus]
MHHTPGATGLVPLCRRPGPSSTLPSSVTAEGYLTCCSYRATHSGGCGWQGPGRPVNHWATGHLPGGVPCSGWPEPQELARPGRWI